MHNAIHGIDKYPDLSKRLQAELRYAANGCSSCARNKIIHKFQHLLSERIKKDSRIK